MLKRILTGTFRTKRLIVVDGASPDLPGGFQEKFKALLLGASFFENSLTERSGVFAISIEGTDQC